MIATTLTKVIYLGNGATREFPIPFKYPAPETVKVGIYDPKTGQTVTLTRDYYVDRERNAVFYPGYPPGQAPAEYEQPGALPAGKKLVVYRETPLTQEIDLGTKYPLPVIEGMDDRNTMMTQELAEKLGRALLADIGSGKTVEDFQREMRENRLAAEGAAEKAQEDAKAAEDSAALAKAWAESEESPDGEPGSKSAKTWAHAAKEEGEAWAALSKAWAEADGSPDGELGSKSAKTWAKKSAVSADKAQTAADSASRVLTSVQQASLYDPNLTYLPGECAMVENGDVYRCIRGSHGENPVTSPKWVSAATTILQTFEIDENGDIMPLAFPQSSMLWSVDDNGDIMAANI